MTVTVRELEAVTRPSVTRRLTEFVCRGQADDAVLERAASALVDTLCVMIAGSGEPGPQRVLASTAALRQGLEGEPSVPCPWNGLSYRPEDAAVIFGTASHVLDFDDVSMVTVCHPSVPVVSAALCARPWAEVSGREILEALAIGTEVMIRIGENMGFRHYELGFHATGTLGTFGAAAASARLMKLSPEQTAHAIAIAASMAGGLQTNFGTMVKSLHVGLAASNGLKAARLAAAGLEGAEDAFEGGGYFGAFTGGEISAWNPVIEFGRPFALVDPGFEQKRYPCCYMLHKAIEACLALHREENLRLADIASVRVDYPVGGTKPLIHPRPKSGMNALFSAPYAVLAALEDGVIDFRSFTDAAVQREEIQARLADVTVREVGGQLASGFEVAEAPVRVAVTRRDGQEAVRSVLPLPGSPKDPLTPDQLRHKWMDCLRKASPRACQDEAETSFERGRNVQSDTAIEEWLTELGALIRAGA